MGTEEEANREVARQQIAPICLPEGQHKQILQEVFPKAGSSMPRAAKGQASGQASYKDDDIDYSRQGARELKGLASARRKI